MLPITNPLIEEYINKHSSNTDAYLYEVYNQTLALHPMHHMQSSWVQGIFLTFVCNMLGAKNVLEIGTFTGFSALCMAKGLANEGIVDTLELREEDAHTARKNFEASPYKNQIHLHLGNAKDTIPALQKEWDLVYIDADKTGYIEYYELVLPALKPNGIIIADNVLFHGEVAEEEIKGKNAKAIDDFNKHVLADDRTEQIILSVRDGLMLIKKK